MATKEPIICATCGALCPPAKRGTKRYCNKKCKDAMGVRKLKQKPISIPINCLHCGNLFQPVHIGKKKYCSILCRNSSNAKKKVGEQEVEKKKRVRKHTNRYVKKTNRKTPTKTNWTPDMIAYVQERYPTDGARSVATALNLTVDAVRIRANRIGMKVSKETRKRIYQETNVVRMIENNPMKRSDVQDKVMAWWDANPDKKQTRAANFLEGRQKVQKTKPSGLEVQLQRMLESLQVEFEPSAIIKDKFIVDIRIGNLIIQADGEYWHGHPRFEPLTERQIKQQRRDRAQDKYLTTCGYIVVRIWEHDLSIELLKYVLKEHGILDN